MEQATKKVAERWCAPKRARWTERDGRAVLAAVDASEESDTEFARRHGIGVHRIQYWRNRLVASVPSVVEQFVQVNSVAHGRSVLDAKRPTEDTRRSVEVTLQNGARVRFEGEWEASAVQPWLRVVQVAA